MRSRFVLFLLVGAAVSSLANIDNEHGWKVGQEYQYLVRSRTLTALNTLSDQYTGILMKAILQIQCNSPDMLRAKLVMPQYAQIHKDLPDGWESHISDQMLQYMDLPMSKQPFAIKMKHGVVRDLIMGKNVPTWEVNIIKSIVSQLQADTQGENAKRTKDIQVPRENNPFAMFHVMEDSVGGKCEVLYDITPLPDYVLQDHPELVPKPELKGEKGEHIYIMKTKNYENCEERVDYHFGISGNVNWDNHRKNNRNFMTKTSTSSIVISGDLKSFAIQSSVTRNQIIMKPRLMDEQDSVVMNKMNLTLASIGKVSVPIPAPNNPESTGNLVYAYNKPFSSTEHRRLRRPSVSPNSNSVEFDDASTWTDSHPDSGDFLPSDEDTTLWQSKPKLDEAPENPLLPLFIGNKGKAVLLSDKIDAVKNVKRLVEEIANELDEQSTMPEQETLEKFTILSRLIGSMSRAQIEKVEDDLISQWNEIGNKEKNQAIKENARAAFRDAVADAGTGPALLTIKKWIEKGMIEEMEAAAVVSRLPKTARLPTSEYMDTFFSLASSPEVRKQMHLNSSAIVSFAELVYLAQVSNSSIHNNYPVHSFGRLSSRHNDAVITKYIPYMAEEMKKAIKDGDSPRIQAYIMALASTGHPKILSVFEPYLEGKEEVSTFQRWLMVASLGKLAEHRPALARSVLYKIYLNTWEAHQIRCTAVFILMKLNPPLDMLLRMAKFTNYDYSIQVNSAVKSAIEQAAELESCEWREHAKQAKEFLTEENYGFPYSQSSITETKFNKRDLAYRIISDFTGSDYSFIPSGWYLSVQSTYGKFVAPAHEGGFMVSSIKSIMDLFNHNKKDNDENKETLVDKIVKMLNIQSDYSEPIEGNYFVYSSYMNHFFAFDEDNLKQLAKDLFTKGEDLKNTRINKIKLMSYDINLSYPTETGLPFVYSLRIPFMHKIDAKTTDTEVDFRLALASKVQGRVGFVTPFDQQRYVSGIDMKGHLVVPGKVQLQMNFRKGEIEVDFNLRQSRLNEDKTVKLLHLSVIPYTSQHSVLSLRPVLLEKNTHIISNEKKTHIKIPEDNDSSMFGLKIQSEDITKNMEWWTQEDDITNWLMVPLSLGRGVHETLDFYLRPNSNRDEAVTLKARFQMRDIEARKSSESNDETWKNGGKAPQVTMTTPNSEERRSKFSEDVTVGMNSGSVSVMDATLELPGALKSRHILTVAVADSDAERKYRSLFYWHMDIPGTDATAELCGNSQMRRNVAPSFDFEQILKSNPKEELQAHIRYGEKCSEGGEITVQGSFVQTDEYKEYLRNSDIAKECKAKTQNGIKSMENCKEAAEFANIVDQLEMKINYDSDKVTPLLNTIIVAMQKTVDTPYSMVSIRNHDRDDDGNAIKVYIGLSPDLTMMDGMISTPDKSVIFADVELEELGIDRDDIKDLQNNDAFDCISSCTIDTNEAVTFDGKSYPVKLGSCSHVLMTTFPKRDPKDNKLWNIPADEKVSIIAREWNGKKKVKIILDRDEIAVKPTDSSFDIQMNGKPIDRSPGSVFQHFEKDENIFEIYELPGPTMRLRSNKFEIDVIFDGERIQIMLPSDYQNSVRGLCGNFDGQPENDFVTPKNCVLKKPEEFTATYALQDKCSEDVLKNAKKAETSMCTKKMIRLSDVISDSEAGRPANWKHWGYHKKGSNKQCNSYRTMAISKDDKICFTMRPVPMCSEGCVPVETKEKNYQLHCVEKNSNSLLMKRRVEQGANPNLSHLPVSATETMTVPLACTAAA